MTDNSLDPAEANQMVIQPEAQDFAHGLVHTPRHALFIRRDALERCIDERANGCHAYAVSIAHEYMLVAIDTHDDHAVIAQLRDVEIVLADAGPERGDERPYLGR